MGNVNVFLYIYDRENNLCTHYQTDPSENLLTVFNDRCQREFFCSKEIEGVNLEAKGGNLCDYYELLPDKPDKIVG